MNSFLFILPIAAVLGWIFSPKAAALERKKMDDESTPYENIFIEVGKKFSVPWQLLSGIAFVESSYNKDAINFADNESIGLMQILCRPDGSGKCSNRFPEIQNWDSVRRVDLFDVKKNIEIGAQILRWNILEYQLPKAIAVYNSWDQRFKSINGPFKNQAYVDKVLKKAKELGYEDK